MPKKNKVKFNICNVHYALQTIGDNGDVSFGTPVPMPVRYPFPWMQTVSRATSMQTATLITPSATTWDMRVIWSLQ